MFKRIVECGVVLTAVVLLAGGRYASRAAECDEPPGVLLAKAPVYPDLARRARIPGRAIVVVEIDEYGHVASARFGPNKDAINFLNDPAMEAAQRWEFAASANCLVRFATLTFEFKPAVKTSAEAGTVFRPPYTMEIFVEARNPEPQSTGSR